MKILIILLILLTPFIAQAYSLSEMDCLNDGNCSLDQGIQYFVNLITWGLGILGSIALLTFILGGFYWLTSGGNPEKVNKGKAVLINSLIGIIIVFVAYTTVNFLLTSLGSQHYESLEAVTENYPGECQGMPEGQECNGVGVCKDSVCVDKCGVIPGLTEYECVDDGNSNCLAGTIQVGKCFGSSDRLCCTPL